MHLYSVLYGICEKDGIFLFSDALSVFDIGSSSNKSQIEMIGKVQLTSVRASFTSGTRHGPQLPISKPVQIVPARVSIGSVAAVAAYSTRSRASHSTTLSHRHPEANRLVPSFVMFAMSAHAVVWLLVCFGTAAVQGAPAPPKGDPGEPCQPEKLTVYKVVLHTFWSRESFPKHYPDWRPPAQWSKVFGKLF
ncbi:hypothetical protein GWI33_008406 [Rhynchophorus ferrugineus]|uniref:Spondin domain-containing protein n=1 Tax=Rhynchophorus ferrugineus TaxID=354439 RepID=A0A834MHD6_RHYFE|nr:hypothetical protein GWI33_008406 [Rhynchophorus ferrugineus]